MGTGLILSSSNVSSYIGQSARVLTSCYLKPWRQKKRSESAYSEAKQTMDPTKLHSSLTMAISFLSWDLAESKEVTEVVWG